MVPKNNIRNWLILEYDICYKYLSIVSVQHVPHGLGVRIPAFHAGGPGSIPGVGASFLLSAI